MRPARADDDSGGGEEVLHLIEPPAPRSGFTNLMTKASIPSNRPGQLARNAVFNLLGRVPPAPRQMAMHMAELA